MAVDRRRSIGIPGTTHAKSKELRRELAADISAAFQLMQADVEILMRRAAREEWTIDKMLEEIDGLLGG
jgi:hypothetical protein